MDPNNQATGFIILLILTCIGIVTMIILTAIYSKKAHNCINTQSPNCLTITCPYSYDPSKQEPATGAYCNGYAYKEDPNIPGNCFCSYAADQSTLCINTQ